VWSERLRINKSKTDYTHYKFDEREIVNETRSVMVINGNRISDVKSYKYLGSIVQKNDGFEEDVKHKIKCG